MVRVAERLTSAVAYHGEGPFWDASAGRLLCLDVLAGAILAVKPSGIVSRHPTPSEAVTVVRRRSSGGFVLGSQSGLIGIDDALAEFDPIVDVIVDSTCRTNDGGCDPLGGFVIGTMSREGRPGAGAVYRVAPDHCVSELLTPVSISNGVQWSANGERVFYIDSPTRRVDVFDFDAETGRWADRRVHIDMGESQGLPDGAAIDQDDGLWVGIWGAGTINHYDAAGKLVEAIRVPGVSQVSSCAFGGPKLDMLYITTSRQGLRGDQEPEAGAVFVAATDARGATPWSFSG